MRLSAGAQQAWVPEEMRSGRRTRATGPAVMSVGVEHEALGAVAAQSVVKVTR